MAGYEYGPVEIYFVEFEGDGLDRGVLQSIKKLTDSSVVRLLDLVVATRAADGSVDIVEVADDEAATALGLDLAVQGLLGEEDIAEASAQIEPGFGVALVALELVWAAELAQNLAAARGTVIGSERIPAAVVNQLISTHAAAED